MFRILKGVTNLREMKKVVSMSNNYRRISRELRVNRCVNTKMCKSISRRLAASALLVSLMVVSLGLVSVKATEQQGRSTRRPPNIVLILADDLGWTDVACMGSKYYETPNIDRLAQQGMKLTSGYTAAPNCAPTRAALMSGQYGPRTGVYTVNNLDRGPENYRKLQPPANNTNLPTNKITMAQRLKEAGYATAIFGKWHLGNGPKFHPQSRGFDEAIVSMNKHFNFDTNPPSPTKPGEYLADFLTDRGIDFIKRHKDRPFFLYLPHFAVHVPHEAKPELIAKYNNKQPVGGHYDPVYAAMIDSLDESVGRIMRKLAELGLSDNTLLIFSSDNGGVGGYRAAGVNAKDNTDNAPLKGGKGMLDEGGVRVPMIMRWTGVIKPGSVTDEPIISVDFYPTFLELAGAKTDPNYMLDGTSFVPLLKSSGKTKLNREAIYWHFPGYLEAGGGGGTSGNVSWRATPSGAIRAGGYKLIEFFEDNHVELYNLTADIGQKNNLADKMPDKARELRAKLAAWRHSIKAPVPGLNPHYDLTKPPQQIKPNRAEEKDKNDTEE